MPGTKVNLRQYDLDWVRVLAFILLIFTHTGLTFTSPYWFIVSEKSNDFLRVFMKFPALWRIPLLFFVSGAAVQFALRKLSTKEFLKKRVLRILIPFLFVWIVFNPLVGYFALMFRNNADITYFQFLINTFSDLDFSRSNSSYWIHLWYLVYLLAYTFIALPIFLYLKGRQSKKWKNPLIGFLSGSHNILFLAALPAISHVILSPAWPRTNNLYGDWDYFIFNFFFFFYGYFVYDDARLEEAVYKSRNFNLIVGILTSLIYTVIDRSFKFDSYSIQSSMLLLIKTVSATSWVLLIIGFGKKYLNFNNKYLKYANEAVYPVFVMHILFQIGISFHVVKLSLNAFAQFSFIFLGTMICGILFYEFFIRRFETMRFLYGLNPRKNKRL